MGFIFPLTTAGGNVMALILVLFWLFSNQLKLKENINQILTQKIALAGVILFFVYLAGMLWSDNLTEGTVWLSKALKYGLLLPALIALTREKYISAYINSFLISITIIAFSSTLIILQLIEPFGSAFDNNPTPFHSHITHSMLLSLGYFFLLHKIFMKKDNPLYKFLYLAAIIIIIVSVFHSRSFAGYLYIFFFTIIFLFQVFRRRLFVFLILSTLSITLFINVFTTLNPEFNKKMFFAEKYITEVINGNYFAHYDSYGIRALFVQDSISLIKENPYIGVGTGDFKSEIIRISKGNRPTSHPHNMYLLIIAQLGFIGFMAISYYFYNYFRFIKIASEEPRKFATPLLIFFVLINLFDTHMLGHYGAMMMIYFTSFIFKEYK